MYYQLPKGDVSQVEEVDGVKLGWACTPQPQQAGPIIPSRKDRHKKGGVSSLQYVYSIVMTTDYREYTWTLEMKFSERLLHVLSHIAHLPFSLVHDD